MTTGTVVSVHHGFMFVMVEPFVSNVFVHASAFPSGQRDITDIQPKDTIEVDDIVYQEGRGYRANFAKRLHSPEHVVKPPQHTDLRGWVARTRVDRGFGYVRQEPHGEFYFHCSDCQGFSFDELRGGDPVMFDVEERNGRERAVNVRLGL